MMLAACATTAPEGTAAPHTAVELREPGRTIRFDFNPESGVSSDSVRAPATSALAAVPGAYERFGLGATVHAAERVVTSRKNARGTTGGVRLSRMLDCGVSMGGSRAETLTLNLSVATRVDSVAPAVTVLRTRVQASGHDPAVSSNTVQCATTGYLEREIATAVQELAR
ncbi:MAG TPA: hypothetical protein VFS56_05405 [Gemmatimonadaceae bacterium]|nr:hypothetical protein [Gemmatimonadaceae bacterium]